MKLYHFCSAQHYSIIKRTGLSKGVIPWMLKAGRPTFIRGYQWLTVNPDWDQSWCRLSIFSGLPYRRNELRLTIDLPNYCQADLYSWLAFCIKWRPHSESLLNTNTDPENWRLYRGTISPRWFEQVDRNPEVCVIENG